MTDAQSKTGMRVLIAGIIILVVGIVLAAIPVTHEECVTFGLQVCATVTTFPYAMYGGAIFIVGLILAIVGGVMTMSGRETPAPGQAQYQQQYQQPYYGQPAQQYQAQNPQYAAQPYPQQQPTPIGTCGYCRRPFYQGETVCQGCGYGIPVGQYGTEYMQPEVVQEES
jgi:hypothetical protein